MAVHHLLALVHFEVDRVPHIEVDTALCRECPHRACLVSCPAECYTLDAEGALQFSYEACLECGTCRIVCDREAVAWDHPRGGFGVGFRYA
jgi:ferredoxin like protein